MYKGLATRILVLIALLVIFVCAARYKTYGNLQPILTADAKEIKNILQKFTQILEISNLTYIMYGGTLLGSCRHHGRIPWDDDVDLLLNGSQKEQVRSVFQSHSSEFHLNMEHDLLDIYGRVTQWKFYSNQGKTIPGHSFKWPFIDIFFFGENATHLWDENPFYRDVNTHMKSRVFPLVRRPFDGLYLPSPCDAVSIVSNQYGLDSCSSNAFSHAKELHIPKFLQTTVNCSSLESRVPFVHRRPGGSGGEVIETLRLGSKILLTAVLPSNCKSERIRSHNDRHQKNSFD